MSISVQPRIAIGVDIRLGLGLKLRNISQGIYLSATKVEIKQAIQEAINSGDLEIVTPEVAICPNCGTSVTGQICQNCNQDLSQNKLIDEPEELEGYATDNRLPYDDHELCPSETLYQPGSEQILYYPPLDEYLEQRLLDLGYRLDEIERLKSDILNEQSVAESLGETRAEILKRKLRIYLKDQISELNRPEPPDISIERIGENLILSVNDDTEYLMPGKGRSRQTYEIKGAKFSAGHLYKLKRQRVENLRKIGGVLMRKRREFFFKSNRVEAEQYLKNVPLSITEAGKEIGIDPSALSMRRYRDALVRTPHGTYPLRQFFSRPAISDRSVTAQYFKEAISYMLDNEIKLYGKVLSDVDIHNELKAEIGCVPSRRQICKYREELNIPPARQRRKEKSSQN